ncbi:MAG: lactate racemase domain-containing protein [Promethearchaeati archaeon]
MKEIIFYGDDAFFYEFPEDIDIYYAKPPITPIKNQELAIEHAIKNPINSPKLQDLINSNSTIAICFDDISVPLPPMKNEIRKIAAEIVLKILKEIGVKDENLYFLCATGLHRKCKPKELKYLLGKKLYRKYKDRIFNHDAEDKINLKTLGKTQEGDKIQINKLATDADLIIYLNISFVPLNGGWKSIIVGLGSYNTIIPHHSPQTLRQGSYMDPESSELHHIIWEMGDLIKDKLKVFTIEMVINNNFYSGIYKRIYKPLKSTQRKPSLWRGLALTTLKALPKFIKAYVRKNLKANYELIDVFAGDIEETHKKSLELMNTQLNVEISKKYDIIIYGVPNLTPYNVGSEMNPLLLHNLVSGYLFNMHQGESPLKNNGTLIISNPAYEKFDSEQHVSYKDFYYDIMTKNHDIFNLKEVEYEYLDNKKYIEKYRNQYAYHPVHAPIVYYWGVRGLLKIENIIVAGAKNKDVLKVLGYEYAENLDEAIENAKRRYPNNCSIAYFCIPPLFIAKLIKN